MDLMEEGWGSQYANVAWDWGGPWGKLLAPKKFRKIRFQTVKFRVHVGGVECALHVIPPGSATAVDRSIRRTNSAMTARRQ